MIFAAFHLSVFAQYNWFADTTNFDVNCAKPGQKFIVRVCYDCYNSILKIDSRPALDSLVSLMKLHPGWKVELASHTDCRTSHAYNDTLSQRRADSAKAYIVRYGIPAEKIVAKGYGERKLLNNCGCEDGKGPGMDCTEAEHQINRRTEFTILENTEDCSEYYRKLELLKCKEFSNISYPCAKTGEFIRTYKLNAIYDEVLQKKCYDSLAKIFKAHKKWNIEIAVYTSCASSNPENEIVSQKIAEMVRTNLIGFGVKSSRLFAKGYGGSKPLFDCRCEMVGLCSEKELNANRRIEFIISENNEKCK